MVMIFCGLIFKQEFCDFHNQKQGIGKKINPNYGLYNHCAQPFSWFSQNCDQGIALTSLAHCGHEVAPQVHQDQVWDACLDEE